MKYLFPLFLMLLIGFASCTSDSANETRYPKVTGIQNDKIMLDDGTSVSFAEGFVSEPSVIFMVRHAQTTGGANNPGLSDEGKMRAAKLDSLMSNVDLKAVLSTTYNRTMETAKPVADSKSITIFNYDPESADRIYQFLFEYEKGGRFLLVGHSNTIPAMVNQLVPDAGMMDINEDTYDRLIVVVGTDKGACKVYDYAY